MAAWTGMFMSMACAAPRPVEPTTAEAAVSPPPRSDEAATRYREGDYVVYRYEGRFSETPVQLVEEVTRTEGNRLWIRVVARRGSEVRQWVQVVTDTVANRDANVIDELYELREGQEIPLVNEANADLLRLYEWTLPDCQGATEGAAMSGEPVEITGESFDCTCTTATQSCAGEPASVEVCECPGFLWSHARALITHEGVPEPFWSMRVVEHGHR
jgi:hypothetical protein